MPTSKHVYRTHSTDSICHWFAAGCTDGAMAAAWNGKGISGVERPEKTGDRTGLQPFETGPQSQSWVTVTSPVSSLTHVWIYQNRGGPVKTGRDRDQSWISGIVYNPHVCY